MLPWIVLSVVFSDSFVTLLNAQGSDRCNSSASWILSQNTGIYGGVVQPSVTSEDGCKQACCLNITCQGIDYNPNNAVGQQCYLQSNTGPKQTFNGVNHWDYMRTDPCGSCGTWTSTPGTGVYGGIQQPATTDDACRAACCRNGTCTGIDWNSQNSAGQQCYLLFGTNAFYASPGVTHWDFNKTAGCQSSCGTWALTQGTGAYGGIVQPNCTSDYACRNICSSNASCTGVDWNSCNNPGQQCFLLLGAGTTYSAQCVNHWDFNRTGSCPGTNNTMPTTPSPIGGCYWTKTANTNIYGGQLQNVYNTVPDCQQGCSNTPGCQSIDFANGNPTGQKCFFFSTQTGQQPATWGVDHYDRKCSGNLTPIATTIATTIAPNYNPNCWTKFTDTNAFGGNLAQSANTVPLCAAACRGQSNCPAFDFDRYKNACYPFNSTVTSTNSAPGVDHYAYVC